MTVVGSPTKSSNQTGFYRPDTDQDVMTHGGEAIKSQNVLFNSIDHRASGLQGCIQITVRFKCGEDTCPLQGENLMSVDETFFLPQVMRLVITRPDAHCYKKRLIPRVAGRHNSS